MKLIDIRSKSDEDVKAELANLKDELFRLKFQHATSQLENFSSIPLVKKDIARVNTVIRERQLEALKKAE